MCLICHIFIYRLLTEAYKKLLDVQPGENKKNSTEQPVRISSSDLEDITRGMKQTFAILLALDIRGEDPGGWPSAYGDEIAGRDPFWGTAETIGGRVQALSPARVQKVLRSGGGYDLGSDVGARVLNFAYGSHSLIDTSANITKDISKCLSRAILVSIPAYGWTRLTLLLAPLFHRE